MKLWIDGWDPAYGSSSDRDPNDEVSTKVDASIERDESQWSPIAPVPVPVPVPVPAPVVFVDGVRRIDARVWIDGSDATTMGICASWAAGAVVCNGRAELGTTTVGRAVFASYAELEPIVTRFGTYVAVPSRGSSFDDLSLALQAAMGADEQRITAEALTATDADADADALVIVDGPLRSCTPHPRSVGMVKSHHRDYLTGAPARVLGALRPGERTPLFALVHRFARLSWYVRLPGDDVAPGAGLVRCECGTDVGVAGATQLADTVTALLPRFASERHKDPRAPQNLYPIAGLERQLRHRLGDADLIYRALRLAVA